MERGMKVRLRELRLEDAAYMLEWMHDDNIVCDMETDFIKMTIEDCETFITCAETQYRAEWPRALHYAVISGEGKQSEEYLGTVSLKNIDYSRKEAEFAIALRQKAMGTGISQMAMKEMIRIGLKTLDLKLIYWYVSPHNARAIRFYEKAGYKKINDLEFQRTFKGKHQVQTSGQYIWYLVKSKRR